ncbi:ER membrane protein complex subunit 10 isoform X2 [Oopsacas minuta]|uniref:ER membrane protein complex subunit 10 n=1 Tax=Oopsacas minuta TaxID=111878 RepID=A0AAV7K0R8_9METZ|nr:ER membrane protein complex subunit 10 isoform X2 [Oopsacas minuta]
MRYILFLLSISLYVYTYYCYTLEISHSCDGVTWESRGVVSIKTEKSLSGNFSQTPISSRLLSCLWLKAQTDEFYHVRAPVTFSEKESPSETAQFVHGFTKSRHLFCSDLYDSLTIYTDSKGGVLSLFSESKRGCVTGEEWSRGAKSQIKEKLSTSLHLVHAHQHPGPEPPVEEFLKEHIVEKEKKERGEDKSFFQKYWQYLLIGFVVYTLMGVLVKAPSEEGGESH